MGGENVVDKQQGDVMLCDEVVMNNIDDLCHANPLGSQT
jgi:hypothetical protein